MKHIKFKLILGFIASILISSCDTRDDYFFEHCEEPVITFFSDNDTTIDGKRFINVDIYLGDEKEIYFDFSDIYGISDNKFQ